jgi:predicted RNA binding protein YcfA (HicA-like mRNA interferase family)
VPKLPSLNPKNIINILERNGFVLDRTKGSHHIYYHPESKRRVIIPFYKKDLLKGTLMEIIRQAGLKKEDIIK